MSYSYEKIIVIKNKSPANNYMVTHEYNLPSSYKKKILEAALIAISKSIDFMDITGYVTKQMNEFDDDDEKKWNCICGYKDSFNITGPEDMGIAFNLGKFKFIVYK